MDWFDFGFSIVFSALKGAVKNEGRKVTLRAAMLKLAAMIHVIWQDDAEFAGDLQRRISSEQKKLSG